MLSWKFNSKKNRFFNSKGQILVEYLLLMVIAVGFATLLIKGLINRGDSPGIIIKQWDRIINTIGNDIPDCAKQKNFSDSGTKCPP